MGRMIRLLASACLALSWARAELPLAELPPLARAQAKDILKRLDFTFQIKVPPRPVKLATVEKLYDRPRLSAAMWRSCAFVPTIYAVELPEQAFHVSDGRGLHGTMTLALKKPGLRVYLADGRVETGRLGNPFPVGAKMITVYRYWEGPKGLESELQTWTALDSALLGFIAKPFRKYIQHRQEEFIAYIFHNIAQGGLFASTMPEEFREPLKKEGDPLAIRQFEEAFGPASRTPSEAARNGKAFSGGGRVKH